MNTTQNPIAVTDVTVGDIVWMAGAWRRIVDTYTVSDGAGHDVTILKSEHAARRYPAGATIELL